MPSFIIVGYVWQILGRGGPQQPQKCPSWIGLTNDPLFFICSLNSIHLYISFLHFLIFKFNFMASALCIMFWSVKCTFTWQRSHFQACYHRYPFLYRPCQLLTYTYFALNSIPVWSQSHELYCTRLLCDGYFIASTKWIYCSLVRVKLDNIEVTSNKTTRQSNLIDK